MSKPSDWWDWYNQVEDLARERSVWEYVNPDTDVDAPVPPPQPHPVNMRIEGVTTLQQVAELNLSIPWNEEIRVYNEKKKSFDNAEKYLMAIRSSILSTIPRTERRGVTHGMSAAQILRRLHTRVKPSIQTRHREMDETLEALRVSPQRKSIEKWFVDWRNFLTDVENCPEYELNVRQTVSWLHRALQPILPSAVTKRVADSMDWDYRKMDLHQEIHWFEVQYELHKNATPRGNVFGTFQGISDSPNPAEQQSSHPKEKRKTKCICGVEHLFTECPYVNPAVRPLNWILKSEVQAKFDNIRHPAVARALKKAKATCTPSPETPAQPHQSTQSADALSMSLYSDVYSANSIHSFSTASEVYPLKNSWIADSGSDTHVCNNLEHFEILHQAHEGDVVRHGDAETAILGFGTVCIKATSPSGGKVPIRLNDVAFIPGMHTSLLSVQRAQKAGFFMNIRRQCVEYQDGSAAFLLKMLYNQYVVEYNHNTLEVQPVQPTNHSFANARSALPPHSTADASLWHVRLGHANTAAIQNLTVAADGVSLPPCKHTLSSTKCETCLLAKAQRQISRRPIPPASLPWEKVYFDFFSTQPSAYNGDRFCLHFICSATGWHVVLTMPNKDQIRLVRAVKGLAHWAKAQFGTSVKSFFSDNDVALGMDFHFLSEDLGFEVLRTARYADSQHGKPERAGGLIMTRMRAMLIAARLPQSLWPLAVQVATYLLNRTPAWTKTADGSHTWTTPYERLFKEKPNLANLRVFGCRAYVRDARVPLGNKVKSRAWIGYMVGYHASNIWQIWNPRHQEVVRERDVIFDETLFYDPDLPLPQDIPVRLPDPQPFQSVQIPPAVLEADNEVADDAVQDPVDDSPHTPPDHGNAAADEQTSHSPDKLPASHEEAPGPPTPERTPPRNGVTEDLYPSQHSPQMPGTFENSAPATPESNHMDGLFLPSGEDLDQPSQQLSGELEDSQPEVPVRSNSPSAAGGEIVDSQSSQNQRNTAVRAGEISADLDPSLVITGKRKRSTRHLFAAFQGFSLSMQKALTPMANNEPSPGIFSHRVHRDNLPPPPSGYREMTRHPLKHLFLAAMELELSTLESKGTWSVDHCPEDVFVIPTIWVYTYKCDDDGYLKRVKARLCVQGNKQVMTHEETRAATLASRCFRVLMALTAAFGLEIKQYDALNAFVNSLIDEVVYVAPPPGRMRGVYMDPSCALRLRRALYGLRRSPRLWQLELTATLRNLGLEPIAEEPCLFVGYGIIILVYVDDILLFYLPHNHRKADDIAQSLQKQYELRYEGNGESFLGVKINRDRTRRTVHLSSTDYIRKIISRFHMDERMAPTPLTKALSPYGGVATAKDIHHYQQKVGCINYAAIATRPDIAKVASHLASFMLNPGPEHFLAVDRVLAYLNYTQHVGIQYNGDAEPAECFTTSSDAAFGDNPDRRSSEGYLAMLYGGPIDWRASRQKTVTTSSTEAELLAMSEAGKTLLWWKRLFKAIDFDPEHDLTIKGDNQQTLRILTKEDPMIRTKLRHVDIHQHWLRQEVQAKRISVQWVPTSMMPADGFTKLLTGQRFANFVRLLRLTEFT